VSDLVLILRYRKAVTYGFHVLLGALETHETETSYEVRFAESVSTTIDEIRAALASAQRVLVLWSFYSPDAAALSLEVQEIKASAPGAIHVAGGRCARATCRETICVMSTITFRTDPAVDAALDELSDGERRERSAIIRDAILQAAKAHRRERIRAESERVASDPDDAAEMIAVQKDMEHLRAW
jgi:predicted transcriptional regulator